MPRDDRGDVIPLRRPSPATSNAADRFNGVPLPEPPTWPAGDDDIDDSMAANPEPTVEPEHKLTELGNAERLAHEHGHGLRYVRAWKSWLTWDGRRWARDMTGEAERAAKKVARSMYGEAAAIARLASQGDDGAADRASALMKWADRSASEHGIRAMVTLAQSEPDLVATPNMFDNAPFALNVLNGTIDLKTGRLVAHRRSDMLTQLAPYRYDPAATCPRWEAFVERVIPDAEVRAWVWKLIGYMLTGDVSEQIIAFLIGVGANGKSTLLAVVQTIFGDYAVQGSPALLMASERGGDDAGRRQRASLRGKRLAVCQEIEAGRYLNEAQVKQLTGGDKITAARLYEDETEFSPTHKIVVAANHKPHVRGQDHGIWRRIRLVPFTVTIPPEERDPHLTDKLLGEAPGILAWAVRGCLAWQREGLGAPPAVLEATESYRDDEDRLGEFLDEHTVKDPSGAVPTADLHRRHNVWTEARGERTWSVKAFASALSERGLELGRPYIAGVRTRAVLGLRLRRDGE